MGVRVEVISFRGNTSSDLIDVADQFTDITQLARVEKGTRSGRRVAGDDADLSMTEVPDKQTEGTGAGRGTRTRGGRGRGRSTTAEPAAAGTGRGRGRGRVSTNGSGGDAEGLVALPGEKLARAGGRFDEADLAAAEVFTLDDMDEGVGGEGTDDAEGETTEAREDGGRRRRRRGGRGRGRGRGRDDAAGTTADRPSLPAPSFSAEDEAEEEDTEEPIVAPRPRSTPFGSVWDSQLGTPAARLGPIAEDDDDFDEPEIPEYLIAEQRQGARGRGGRAPRSGPRGGRSAYQSAVARERYGRGGTGGINRYPDVSARTTQAREPREDRGYSRGGERQRDTAPRSSTEPWSEVPPELEAMLRAQVTQRPATRPESPSSAAVTTTEESAAAPVAEAASVTDARPAGAETPAPPKRRTTRTGATAKKATSTTTKVRTTRKTAATGDAAPAGDAVAAEATSGDAAPKRRTTRKTAASVEAEAPATGGATTRRRTTRKAPAAPTETD
jgi:hypothetical protein